MSAGGPGQTCQLCGRDDEDVEAFGLSICHHCEVGAFDEWIHDTWGANVMVERRHLADVDGQRTGESSLTVTVEFDGGRDLEASFVAERGTHALIKLFFAELQVGDSRFDDAIYIRDSDHGAAGEFLDDRGLQQAILFCVEHHGEVRIRQGQVTASSSKIDDDMVGSFILATVVTASHVAR